MLIAVTVHFSSILAIAPILSFLLEQFIRCDYQGIVSYKRVIVLALHDIKKKLKVNDRTFPRNVNESSKYCRSQVIRINLNLL